MLLKPSLKLLQSFRPIIPKFPPFKYNYSTLFCNNKMTEPAPALGQLPTKKVRLPTTLDHLKQLSKVVADTANFTEIDKYQPEDSTTNPSLLLQVVSATNDFSLRLLDESIDYVNRNFNVHCQSKKKTKSKSKKAKKEEEVEPVVYGDLGEEEQVEYVNLVIDHLSVSFGAQLLKKLPGYVSTEVDAALSYDKQGTVERAKRIIALYKEKGVEKDKVLIKIASTWQGIKAAEVLRKSGINCNMTLIFNKSQAIQCAESKLFLISPFVGRILDWNKKNYPTQDFSGANDPGVKSVKQIYNYFKFFKYDTIVMAASFRNTSEILELAGCDRLTISPSLLKELEDLKDEVPAKLSVEEAVKSNPVAVASGEKQFHYDMMRDAMATEKLAEGIRKFDQDTNKLRELVRKRLEEAVKDKKEEAKEEEKVEVKA